MEGGRLCGDGHTLLRCVGYMVAKKVQKKLSECNGIRETRTPHMATPSKYKKI